LPAAARLWQPYSAWFAGFNMTGFPLHRLAAAAWLACAASAMASTSGVVISQVYGGGGNTGATYKNDFIELFNAGSAAVSLNGWSVQYASAAGSSWTVTALGNVSLQPGQYYLIQQAAGTGGTTNLPTADKVGTINMSGTTGKVALVSSTTALTSAAPASSSYVDLVGFGTAGGYEGAVAPAPSNTNAILRAASGCTDTDSNSTDFAAGTPNPRNTSSTLNVCSGGSGGSGGGTGTTATPRTIPQIQGSGSTSAYVSQLVQTSGVVTKLTNVGFFMQDLTGDGDASTSDGIYVYLGSAPTVSVGNLVQLSGTVAEFNVGAATNTDTAAHTVTELTGVSAITVQGTGYSITPTAVTLPETVDHELEKYEGMLVTINGPFTVAQNYFLGRYGQLTLSVGGRMETPTNAYRPGSSQAVALADLNARSRILLDDGTSAQNVNPTPYLAADNTVRAGDTVASLTGVVDYGLATSSADGFGDWKLHPTTAVSFTRVNTRTSAPVAVGGNVKVASFNVLNFFTTFTNGATAAGQTGQGCTLDGASAAANCRGADNAAEFTRQRDKIVAAITAMDADVIGLMEMQNNGSTAIGSLVSGLNAVAGAGTYAAVSDPASGTGTDAIKVAILYKPARVTPVGGALSDTDAINNRPPLAQVFKLANNERFAVVVNHLKSKGSCPAATDADYAGNFDAGDGQGCWNARRVSQAQRLRTWLGSSVTPLTGNVVLVGDFNSYAKEDPINDLTSNGLVDQIARYNSFGYSYVFDGAAGRLDHAITTSALSPKVTRAVEWHINADEPLVLDYNTEFKQPACASCNPDYYSATAYRSSDHDPVVLGLDMSKLITGTANRDVLVGTAGVDRITGGAGADTLTGGAGADVFVYTNLRDAGDTITDFSPGADQLDISALLLSLGWAGSNPVSEGVVQVVDSARGAVLQVSSTGRAGGLMRPVATLSGVSASQIVATRDLVVRSTSFGILNSARYRKVKL
jgi:predicted extracellular nuclease